MFSFFGNNKTHNRGHEAETETRQPRKDYKQERKPSHQKHGHDAEMEPRHPRKIRPSDDDRRHWVAEPDIDRKAQEFIDREHRRMVPEQN